MFRPENRCCEVNKPVAETQSCYSQSDPKEKPNENHVEFDEFHAFDVALDYVAVDACLMTYLSIDNCLNDNKIRN